MPGVPRPGCDRCKSHKKKCDLQLPRCSRCRLRNVPCTGIGQQRLKWLVDVSGGPGRGVASNERDMLAKTLVSQLKVANDDIRYSITWLWGPHMLALPCRFGHNVALDRATSMITGIHLDLCSPSGPGPNMDKRLADYSRALTAVRHDITAKGEQQTAETLCAMQMLAMGSVVWEGPIASFSSPHARGLAEILKLQGFPIGQNDFEKGLYHRLRAIVALLLVVDPVIHLTESQWRVFEASFPGNQAGDRILRCAVRMGELMVDARRAVPGSSQEQALYLRATELQRCLDDALLDAEVAAYDTSSSHSDKAHVVTERAMKQLEFNEGLIFCALLLCVRRALLPANRDITDEVDRLSSRALRLAEVFKGYRPLGGNWALHCLMATWCAVKGMPAHQSVVEEVMHRWREDPGNAKETEPPPSWIPPNDLLDLYGRVSLGRGQMVTATSLSTTLNSH